MPWGWECRAKLIKQNPAKRTVSRDNNAVPLPGPDEYEIPPILGGKGFNKIKRAPAYTFGQRTALILPKPASLPHAPQFDIQGMSKKGRHRITHGVLSDQIDPNPHRGKMPGPANYAPNSAAPVKQAPVYSMRPAARPPFKSKDQWTPPPNMYWPPIPCDKSPAYTLGHMPRNLPRPEIPGPGCHEPQFQYVMPNKPAFSFGAPFRRMKASSDDAPAPNAYCEKKFPKKPTPALSFGIHHSPYLGKQSAFEKPNNLKITLKSS